MARSRARGVAAILASLAWAGGCAGPTAANGHPGTTLMAAAAPAIRPVDPPPPPRDPTPTRLWPFKRLFNVDYVDVAAIAERFGLEEKWVTSGRVLELVDARGRPRLRFQDRDRDFHLDGVRIFLGESTVGYQGGLWVSKIDVIKTIAPLLRPAEHAGGLPRPPRLIVLDAGHGGTDDGTSNRRLGLLEKNLTLDTVRRLEALLIARGYRVVLTRTDDHYVSLDRRDEIAVAAHADLFISVHFNSADARVSGVETWVMTPQFQTSTEAEQDKSMIPTAYPGNHQDHANILLGFAMHHQLLTSLGSADRGLKRRRLAVLRMLDCPGVLLESAYLSNEAEARRVATPEYRQRIAEAMAHGVDDYVMLLGEIHPGAGGETRRPAISSR